MNRVYVRTEVRAQDSITPSERYRRRADIAAAQRPRRLRARRGGLRALMRYHTLLHHTCLSKTQPAGVLRILKLRFRHKNYAIMAVKLPFRITEEAIAEQ